MAPTKGKKTFGSAEAWTLFREAGYSKPTHLQQRLVPIILKGKDVAAEAEGDSGKTAAFILPLSVKLKRGKTGIKAIVLTSTTENSHKVFREFRRFVRSGKKPSIFTFGLEGQEKKEHRMLSRNPDVVIGTPNKVIDHIRRGNLDFSNLQTVVIDRTVNPEHPGFVEDILFIFSKLPQKKQTILISHSLEKDTERLVSALRRPTMLPMATWKQLAVPVKESFIMVEETQKSSVAVKLIMAEPMESLLIQCENPRQAAGVQKQMRSHQIGAALLLDTLSLQQQNKVCQSFSVGKVPILISTFNTTCGKSFRWVTHVINLSVPPRPESYKPRSFVLKRVITLGEDYDRFKERIKVEVEKSTPPSEEQVFQGMIRQILKRIKEEEEPEVLNHYRSIVRKNVPLTLRSYFTAYLFKQSLSVEKKKKKNAKLTKLFLSMGKNRRVFARDLIQLFTDRLKAQKSQIHEIKILDNYSFIEVDASLGERAIQELSGIEFKGRKLAVNYARKREDKRESPK
ncbi:MAG: DEAD/DEAH box helicase [Spirochaetaceae bacterium]|nr:MAG: DEAD/DEAH box helicase [Spirochaetaceae bacterium]